MTRKDEAVNNFDDYLNGWFFRRPGMERMLDASKGEKAAKKAFDENFAALNDKMDGGGGIAGRSEGRHSKAKDDARHRREGERAENR